MSSSLITINAQNQNRWRFLPLLILFVAALALRMVRLFDLDLNFDEVVLLFQAEGSFSDIWNSCKLDNFPPLYPWLIKVWTSLFPGDVAYRIFGALLSSLTPPAAYLLGCEVLNRRLGWLLGIATAISVSLIFYSQFVRMFNVQPLFVCLSLLWFIRALKTNQWRYWLLTALANLLGFYVYIFMLFLVSAQGLYLLLSIRFRFKLLLRPLAAHLFFLLGMLLWLVPLLGRYTQVEQGFWTSPLSLVEITKTWVAMGMGADYRDHYWLAAILNFLLLWGCGWAAILLIVNRGKNVGLTVLAFVLVTVIWAITFISLLGQSFVHIRYLVFLLPLYLALALTGWLEIKRTLWRKIGLISLFTALAFSLIYYYIDYYYMYRYHYYYGNFLRPLPYAESGEGHNLSAVAAEVAANIGPDEVLIHYSNPYLQVCSYYACLHYHKRSLPEYIYSPADIAWYNGRQYLRPGEWLRSLADLQPLPAGIWMISLEDSIDAILRSSGPLPKWAEDANLPLELQQAGYERTANVIRRGRVSAIYFRRSSGIASSSIKL